ncbi:MAG: hypothetical protein V3T24_03865 [Longimicrobiales bacterium]
MKILRDAAAFVLVTIGMAIFLVGGGIVMLAVLISGNDDLEVDLDAMKVPVSPVEKRAEN